MQSWIIELPSLWEYFYEVDNGQKYGPPFPTSFEKVGPFLKEIQTKLMVRFGFLKQDQFTKMSDAEFQTHLSNFKNQLQISAAIIMVEIQNWAIGKQILTDLAASKDGILNKKDNVR